MINNTKIFKICANNCGSRHKGATSAAWVEQRVAVNDADHDDDGSPNQSIFSQALFLSLLSSHTGLLAISHFGIFLTSAFELLCDDFDRDVSKDVYAHACIQHCNKKYTSYYGSESKEFYKTLI